MRRFPHHGRVQRTCGICSTAFDVTAADLAFLEKLSPAFGGKKEALPPPTLCPGCRQQRRLLWRNERRLCRRTCGLCGKPVISMYAKDKPFPVHCTECWWGDRWDPLSFGRAFDFSRPFFPQFRALQEQVPRLALNVVGNENSEYVNLGGYNKNCYLVFAMEYNEDCLYGTELVKSVGCVDTFNCFESQYCYEATDVEKCHRLFFSRDCSGCADGLFLSDCRNCNDCMFCANLRGKRYCVRNKQRTREEYGREKAAVEERIATGGLPQLLAECAAFERARPHRAASVVNSENVTGDYLKNSRNLHRCFDVSYGEDCAYVYTGFKVKDLLDVCHTTEGELSYEALSLGYGSYGVAFTHGSWTSKNILYCDIAQSSQDCFGCVGLKRNRHCILNRQYAKEEYEKLVPRIIEHMRKTPLRSPDGSFAGQEWGEFFPAECAPFAYNETTALQYFPLRREEALARGFAWQEERDEVSGVSRVIPASQLPDSIDDISDDIVNWAIECEATKRPFKIIKQELEFYRKMRLPVPRFHPDERHRRRIALRNPRKLWKRNCGKCGKEMETTYAPDRPEKVYCEECYLKEVY